MKNTTQTKGNETMATATAPRPGQVDLETCQAITTTLNAAGIRYRTERCDWSPDGTDTVATDYRVWAHAVDRMTGSRATVEVHDVAAVAGVAAKLQSQLSPRIADAKRSTRVDAELEQE